MYEARVVEPRGGAAGLDGVIVTPPLTNTVRTTSTTQRDVTCSGWAAGLLRSSRNLAAHAGQVATKGPSSGASPPRRSPVVGCSCTYAGVRGATRCFRTRLTRDVRR